MQITAPSVAFQIAGLILILSATHASATSFAQPERHDVFSPNGDYVLDINPQSNTLTVFKATDRSTPIWSFKSGSIWHEPYFVSNDGRTVAVLAWRYIQNDSIDTSHCVEFWSASGLLKTHAFSDLCPNPARTRLVGIGPIGGFWRTWYTDASLEGSQLKVHTTDWRAYTFDMTSGQVTESHILLGNLRYKPLTWVLGTALLLIGVAATVRYIRRGKRSTTHLASTAA